MEAIPRYYQALAVDSVLFAWCEYQRVLLQSPTGSGKNFMAARIIKEVYPSRCLFAGDQDELCFQPASAIERFAGIIPSIEKAKDRASLRAKVIVGSVQTISRRNRLENFPPDFFDYIIMDEAHRGVLAKQRIMEYFAKAKVCGLTATPFRAEMKNLSKWYEEVAFKMPMDNLIEEGFAPPYSVLRMPVEIDLGNVLKSRLAGDDGKEDYDAESLSTTIAPYYERIIQLLLEQCSKRRMIVFLPLIKSSQAFAAMARKAGLSAIHVDGKSDDRNEIIERFKRGQYQMLTNANLVTTGVDIPIADCFVNLTPMRSPSRYIQMFGRVMRVLPGVIDDLPHKFHAEERKARIAASAKKNSCIVDFLWQHDKLNVYRPENMIAKDEQEAAEIFEIVKKSKDPVDILAIQKMVQAEREAQLAKKLEEIAAKTSGRKIEPQTLGFLIGSKSLMSYEPVARWELQSASAKQIAMLEGYGIDVRHVNNMGLAKKLLDICMHRARFRMASVNQLQALANMKVKFNPQRITMRDATKLLTEAHMRSKN